MTDPYDLLIYYNESPCLPANLVRLLSSVHFGKVAQNLPLQKVKKTSKNVFSQIHRPPHLLPLFTRTTKAVPEQESSIKIY